MRSPLTTDTVMTELNRLHAAFPRNLGKQDPSMMAAVYKDGLRGVETDALRGAVDACIQADTFYPKVARLREAASEWMRRNRARYAPTIQPSWDTCGVCGVKAMPRLITRPVITKPNGDPKSWHYVLADGRKIPYGDVAAVASVGPLLPMETVESTSTFIDHNPAAHHVRNAEPDEYEDRRQA